ncbi:MAG: T9SS type A sorting domain-containing protein [Flavobacteriales bacterium]
MKHFFTFCFSILLATGTAFAQPDCTGGRYSTFDLFSDTEVTSGVTFGSNTALGGSEVDLKMDVYEPAGDTDTDRPVVIVAFGGSFIGGDRSQVAFMCEILAKMGYVAVAPDYRVGLFFPSQITTTLAVLRGAHDVSGCVRYLKKTAAEDGNPYGIDCERIIVGGISAGAIAAIHSAYFDKIAEIPSYMENDTAGLGGVTGNSGTPNYPHDAIGVLSFSGAIGDTAWMEPGDAAIVSIHEENDNVVPYYTQEVAVSGIPTGLIASGSGDVHVRAANLGLTEDLLGYAGVTGHVGYLNPIDQDALDFMRDFLLELVCNSGRTNSCAQLSSGIADVERNSIKLFPNPATDVLNFNSEETATIEIIDAIGRVVLNGTGVKGQNRLDVSKLPSGSYTLRTVGETIGTAHFIKE